jgi:L-asparaginase
LAGVFVIFENNRGDAIVHLGTRLKQSDPFTDEYDSTYSATFGVMINKQFSINSHELNPSLISFQTRLMAEELTDPITFSTDILYIKSYPGLNYQHYNFSAHKPKAVLHDLYHSGTACTRTSDLFHSSMIDFLIYCKEHGVNVYVAPLKNKVGDLYASSIQLISAGAIPIGNISIEAALVKLMLAYGSFKEHSQVLQFMQETSLYFEIHKKYK